MQELCFTRITWNTCFSIYLSQPSPLETLRGWGKGFVVFFPFPFSPHAILGNEPQARWILQTLNHWAIYLYLLAFILQQGLTKLSALALVLLSSCLSLWSSSDYRWTAPGMADVCCKRRKPQRWLWQRPASSLTLWLSGPPEHRPPVSPLARGLSCGAVLVLTPTAYGDFLFGISNKANERRRSHEAMSQQGCRFLRQVQEASPRQRLRARG